MSLAARIARAIAPLVTRSGAPVPDWPLWRSLIGPWTLPPEALEYPLAFKLVPTVFFSISIIQDALAAVPLRFYEGTGDEKVEIERETGNIADLWGKANPLDTGYDLAQQVVGSLLIQGNAYIFKVMKGRKVTELWCLAGDTVSPIAGADRTIAYYNVDVGAGQYERVGTDQIVQIKMYTPDHGVLGYSPLGVLRKTYQTQYDAGRWLAAFYEKGGTVAGHYSTEMPLEDGDVARVEKSIRRRFMGPEHAWEPVILPRKLQYVRAGLTLKEMQFIENAKLTREQILEVFKIPPAIAGLTEGSGLNSDVMNVAQTLLVQNALEPMASRIEAYLNEKLLKSGVFGNVVTCAFDFSGMPIMQHSRLARAKMYTEVTGGPIMSREIAQEEFGLEVNIDDLLIPAGMQTASDREAEANRPVVAPAVPEAASRSSSGTDRSQLRARAGANVSRYERMQTVGWRRLLRQQEARAVASLKEAPRSYANGAAGIEFREAFLGIRIVDAEALLKDPKGADRRLVRRMTRATVAGRGSEALAELGLDVAYDLNATAVGEFIRDHSDRALTAVNKTTAKELRRELAESAEAGETISEAVERVREVFGDRRDNAITIARTETVSAYNFASISAWKQSGQVGAKQWLTAEDDAVRDWHREVDGKSVPLDASFSVGPDQLDFPGDPRGSAGNIINCRCTLVADVVASDATEESPSRNGHSERSLDELLAMEMT